MNWVKLIKKNVKPELRQVIRLAWLNVLFTKVKSIHAAFLIYRDDVNYRISITGQTMVLERFLNLFYYNTDPVSYETADLISAGLIYIENNPDYNNTIFIFDYASNNDIFIYDYASNQDKYFFDYLTLTNGIDFIVWIPAALYTSCDLLQAIDLVNRYKLCDKNFIIKPY